MVDVERTGIGRGNLVEKLLYGFSVYAVPIAVAAFSIVAIVFWAPLYPALDAREIAFRAAEVASGPTQPAAVAARLALLPSEPSLSTNRSESPFWFLFQVQRSVPGGHGAIVEFPSRHAVAITCWQGPGWTEIGSASRNAVSGRLAIGNTGFVLDADGLAPETDILCSSRFIGPARMTVLEWPEDKFRSSQLAYHFDHGWLEGGALILLMFVLLMAAITREVIYVTFAAWLAINLRLALLTAGWDTYWLEHAVPADALVPLRQISVAAYYVLTAALFSQLFREELTRVGYTRWLRLSQWSCVPVFLLSLVLPFAVFLPVLWVATAFFIGVLGFLLIRILRVARSTVAILYAVAIAFTLIASLSEVLSAAFGLTNLIGLLNSVTAALTSSLVVTLAIAERMRLEHLAKERAETALCNAYEAIPIGLFTLDLEGLILQGNPALLDLLSVRSGRQAGHWNDHLPADEFQRLCAAVTSDGTSELEIHCNLHGREVWLTLRAKLAHAAIEGSILDDTERRKATDRLRFLADHDFLTGTLNRRGIEAQMATALASGEPALVAYFDLERFQLINDLHGRAAGDEVLMQLCRRAADCVADLGIIGRMGGDEFVIVFSCDDVDTAASVCRSIIEGVEERPFHIGDMAFRLRVSIGLIETPPGISVTDAISSAEQACRQAKKKHGAEALVFRREAAIFTERAEELQLIKRFDTNTVTDSLLLVMQPVMSLNAPYASLNFETLLRTRDADGRVTSAGSILATAEQTGRIATIDRWVLQSLLEWMEREIDRLGNTQFICMNLSGGSLNDERFIADACAMLANNERVARKLCVEITEGVALRDYGNTKKFIGRVRDFGVRVALDDFGAGYTSFSYLRHLPADVLKIDGDFVRDAHLSPINLGIVETIADLARNLGMKTIAEWTENLPSVRAMAEVGIDYVQGYAIARPMPPEEILKARSCAEFVTDPDTLGFLELLSGDGSVASLPRGKRAAGRNGFH